MSEAVAVCKNHVNEVFGKNVFNELVMRERLPKYIYKSLMKTMENGSSLDPTVAEVVASTMKDWAIEKGATHFTHWFQPMTGITAEKHDAFISPTSDGRVIMEFSGKELIQGEPDASSFPSGGLRATFEARGYTAWDPTSYAFVKDGSLCIPTAFCSYSGEALDKKTPLLRSMQAVNRQAKRVLRLFGNNASRVVTTVGAEQEYFLIDKKMYDQRKDLIFTGRTLFGAKPPKGQELEDHYFGKLKERVAAYMQEVDEELWKLGVSAKTKHNEVAPAQHELACIFNTSNIATDQNQIVMEVLQKVAGHHGLVCLLHEKPFAGVNGSGKHNNWSISTNLGENLLEPGDSPEKNAQFLTFLCAVIKAVDTHADLLRLAVASAGNDHRLGANEAPPAIISMFLGEQLTAVIEAIEKKEEFEHTDLDKLNMHVKTLPSLLKDNTDRNRTSPFAFTGNKFEFRMLGSALSIAGPNVVLNTIVADVLREFADLLENSTSFHKDLQHLLRKTIREHKRIIFNGNNYSQEWVDMAKERGLLNLESTVDAIPKFVSQKNIDLFTRHNVYSATEMHSRCEILLENYSKTINIEALAAIDMAKKQILPAVLSFQKEISDLIASKKSTGITLNTSVEEELLIKLSDLTACLSDKISRLTLAEIRVKEDGTAEEIAKYFHAEVFSSMQELRIVADELETMVPETLWPFPTYSDILFNV